MYWVEVNQGHCTVTDSVTIDVIDVDLGNDVVLCYGEEVLFESNIDSAIYLWQDGSISDSLSVNNEGL